MAQAAAQARAQARPGAGAGIPHSPNNPACRHYRVPGSSSSGNGTQGMPASSKSLRGDPRVGANPVEDPNWRVGCAASRSSGRAGYGWTPHFAGGVAVGWLPLTSAHRPPGTEEGYWPAGGGWRWVCRRDGDRCLADGLRTRILRAMCAVGKELWHGPARFCVAIPLFPWCTSRPSVSTGKHQHQRQHGTR